MSQPLTLRLHELRLAGSLCDWSSRVAGTRPRPEKDCADPSCLPSLVRQARLPPADDYHVTRSEYTIVSISTFPSTGGTERGVPSSSGRSGLQQPFCWGSAPVRSVGWPGRGTQGRRLGPYNCQSDNVERAHVTCRAGKRLTTPCRTRGTRQRTTSARMARGHGTASCTRLEGHLSRRRPRTTRRCPGRTGQGRHPVRAQTTTSWATGFPMSLSGPCTQTAWRRTRGVTHGRR